MRILLVEDHRMLVENLLDHFEDAGHDVDVAVDGRTGLRLARDGDHDVCVLDLSLPRLDGIDLCRRLRAERGFELPILILTARDTLDDKLAGFEAGADDYLVKPFALDELTVRLAALARRPRRSTPDPKLTVADLELDPATWKLTRGDQELQLNRTGMLILRVLMAAAPNVVPRGEIEQAVWGDHPPGPGVLRTHIHAVRRAVDANRDVPLVHNVHGVGYRCADEA